MHRASALACVATLLAGHAMAGPSPAPTPREVVACDIAFQLPGYLRVTSPKRSVNADGVPHCEFQILRADRNASRAVCLDDSEGEIPAGRRCAWKLETNLPAPRVIVAKTRFLTERKETGAFAFADGRWSLTQGHEKGEQPIQQGDFFGYPSLTTETVYPAYWVRIRPKKNAENDRYAGSGGTRIVLLQLSETLAVYMEPPPPDVENGADCDIFCSSLAPAEAVPKSKR